MILSIVIVSWNCWDHLYSCLLSIKNFASGLDYEVIIIDNSSKDETVCKTRKLFPEFNIYSQSVNLGFAKANNIGFQQAKGKYILALNPDTELFPDTLQESIKFLENNKEYGCCGVKILLPDGRIQYHGARQFITLRGALFEYLYLDKIFTRVKFFKSPDMPFWDHESNKDVDMISGAYMLFPRYVYKKIGGFNEILPLFFEDCEFCLRIWESGLRIRYISSIKIIHYTGQSSIKAHSLRIWQLRFEACYSFIKKHQGKKFANQYVLYILILVPIKFFILPFLEIGFILKYKKGRIKDNLIRTFASFLWSLSKIVKLPPPNV